MANGIKVDALTEDSIFNDDDYILVFGNEGTRRMKKSDFGAAFMSAYNLKSTIPYHRMPRQEGPKNLGPKVTASQKAAIQKRTYNDMFVGDYWSIGDQRRIIADVDYFHKTGDKDQGDGGDLLMVNENADLEADKATTIYMNATATTDNGFASSKMWIDIIPNTIVPKLTELFGDNLFTHREYLSNKTDDGIPTNGAWVDAIYLPFTEEMFFGTSINGITNGGAGQFNAGLGKTQVALFKWFPEYMNRKLPFWFRNIVSDKAYAAYGEDGLPFWADADSPFFDVWGYYVLH